MLKGIQNKNVQQIKDEVYLCHCALSGKVPAQSRLEKMNISRLLRSSRSQGVSALCAYALSISGASLKAGGELSAIQRENKSIQKALLAAGRRLSQEGIWHMPLYPHIVKDLYPASLRELDGVEILIDAKYRLRALEILGELNYLTRRYGGREADEYFSDDVYSFKVYINLLTCASPGSAGDDYYSNIYQRLIKDESGWCCRLSDNDLYVYMTARHYCDYRHRRLTLSSVADRYVYLQKMSHRLDRYYIAKQLGRLGIVKFESAHTRLANSLFTGQPVDESGRKLLSIIAAHSK